MRKMRGQRGREPGWEEMIMVEDEEGRKKKNRRGRR
jgi:hypothetical protein